jgi:hypothetical protein
MRNFVMMTIICLARNIGALGMDKKLKYMIDVGQKECEVLLHMDVLSRTLN